MELSDKERGILKQIVTSQAFELFKEIQLALDEQWSRQPLDGETSFLVAKDALKRQERNEGIKLFIKTLEEICL